MKRITFYLDFISPYAWLAFERLPEVLEGLTYSVTYQPVLQLGVCAGSSVQEAAVQALRAMLAESFQKTITDAFPVSTAVLQAQLQQEIDVQKTYQQAAIREEGYPVAE